MGYRLIPTATFERSLARLDTPVTRRITAKLTELEETTRGILPLSFRPKGLGNLCKFKVGEWRVFLWLDEVRKEITLYAVWHRKEAYKNLLR
ncbi:MAG: hypothetical protein Q7R93_04120 [bacterium]|nr:hypothetical protein [bacterium]